MIDEAFEALKTYNWGAEIEPLKPIEDAIVATQDDPAGRVQLERRLVAILKTDLSRDAKDYVCRQLRVIGTAESVPVLADLLNQAEHSHMARYALERIPASQAAQAMRDALPQLSGQLKIGVIGSLGVRQDTKSVPALAGLLRDADQAVACSAALALGAIQTPAAAEALKKAKPESATMQTAVADALLACAEAFLAAGQKSEALALYQGMARGDRPKHVRLAATRGMLACAGQTE